jgi:hypothetical protein
MAHQDTTTGAGVPRAKKKSGGFVGLLAALGALMVWRGFFHSPHNDAQGLLGLLFMYPWLHSGDKERKAHEQDLANADDLRTELRSGVLPAPVPPDDLRAAGQQLGAGETCFVDGAPVEVAVFYGVPVVRNRRFLFAWGGPLAWAFSIFATLGMYSHSKRVEREAAPQWRDPESGRLWVTNRRCLVHGVGGNRAWIEIPWGRIVDLALEDDGVAMTLADAPERPIKLKVAGPAWHYVLVRYLADGVIADVPAPPGQSGAGASQTNGSSPAHNGGGGRERERQIATRKALERQTAER